MDGIWHSPRYLKSTFPRDYQADPEVGRTFVLIDMQEKFLEYLKPSGARRLITSQKTVLDYCRRRNLPVAVLRYDLCGKTIAELSREIKQLKRTEQITKTCDSGFTGTDLDALLRSWGTIETYLMGVNANFCVESTGKDAKDLGYQIITADCLIANYDSCKEKKDRWFKRKGIYLR